MGHPTRLRISLADRSGALAQAATVIGLHGGNIMSIDVLSAGGDSAVDDLVIDFHSEPDLAELAEDLAADAGATLMSHQPAEVGDLIERTLHLAASLAREVPYAGPTVSADHPADPATGPLGSLGPGPLGPDRPVQALCEALRALTGAASAWISGPPDAGAHPVGLQALATGRPAAGRSPTGPGQLSAIPTAEACVLAIPHPGGDEVIFLARVAPNDFTPTEVTRAEALTSLYVTLSGR